MQVLKIRAYQLKRNLGFLLVFLLPACSGLSYFFFNNRQQLGYYTAGVIMYVFYSFHKNRRDKVFAAKHFDYAKLQIAAEYQLFLLPVSVPCLFTAYWYCFPAMHIIVFGIPFIEWNVNLKPRLLFLPSLFKQDYTFISGIRRNFFGLVLLILLALLLSPLKLFPLLALFLLNAVVFGFYEYNESVQMLQASRQTPKAFLSGQTVSAVLKLAIVHAPVILVNSIVNADVLLFNLYFVGYSFLILTTVIAMKYADYGYKKEKNNYQVKLAVMLLGLFIPYVSVLTLIFYVQSRAEALKNLTHYLDDQRY